MVFTKIKTKRQRPVKSITKLYRRLHEFRVGWESKKGGTRGSLRLARKQQHTLFPTT